MTIKQRLIVCAQNSGNFGASTLFSELISWLDFSQLSYFATDTDRRHHTLSRKHPGKVYVCNYEDIQKMDNALSGGTAEDESNASGYDPPQPTVIIDLPEGIFSLDDHCKRTGIGPLLEFLDTDEVSGRLTLLVFASDDLKAIESAHQVLNTFGGQADYILVENPAVFTSDKFKTLWLYTHFLESSAPKIVLPNIPAFSSEARLVSLTDALKDPALTHASFVQISAARDCLFYQFEDCASLLVPDVSLIKNQGAAA